MDSKLCCALIFIISLFININNIIAIEYSYNEDDTGTSKVYDPFEKVNRKIYRFNDFFDRISLHPMAIVYNRITNDYIKARVGNVFENISMPLTTVNYIIQLRFEKAHKSLWRFLINTTFGLGGLFDIASKTKIEANYQTFGNTLAYYGVCSGPYIVIPFLGSSGLRDALDLIILNVALNPLSYSVSNTTRFSVLLGQFVYERASILPFSNFIDKSSTDPYIAVRSAIFQNREYKVEYTQHE